MNRWGVRAFFLSAGEKFGAGRKTAAIHSTPMVYDHALCFRALLIKFRQPINKFIPSFFSHAIIVVYQSNRF
jgi:hypothetical protein